MGHAGEVYEVGQRVDAVEGASGEDAAYECLAGGAVAAGVFAEEAVGASGGLYGGPLLEALGGEAGAEFLAEGVYFLPEGGAGGGIDGRGQEGRAAEVGAEGAQPGGEEYLHGAALEAEVSR